MDNVIFGFCSAERLQVEIKVWV